MTRWRPQADLSVLARRAQILALIRQFFADHGVLEVETPLAAATTASDIHIHSFPLEGLAGPGTIAYLQTSPEFAMKRLLASGSGSIYQLGKVFRQEEAGRRHNPEFTLLEWYRTGFSLEQLMDEVERLMGILLDAGNIPRFSYQQLFQQHLAIDPHSADDEEIKTLCNRYLDVQGSALDRTDYLQLLLAEKIEPSMPPFCFVYDFPAAQASLAAVTTDGNGQAVARRFELFGGGMELANGYFELTDATEQRRRFTADNKIRQQRGLPQYPIDENLLAALESGLPPCSGVAMGIDRVVMLACGLDDIGDSMAFPVDRI